MNIVLDATDREFLREALRAEIEQAVPEIAREVREEQLLVKASGAAHILGIKVRTFHELVERWECDPTAPKAKKVTGRDRQWYIPHLREWIASHFDELAEIAAEPRLPRKGRRGVGIRARQRATQGASP
ncbi:MAG: hypothetical protein AAGD38_15295 [Acidobacteriota bacterium]